MKCKIIAVGIIKNINTSRKHPLAQHTSPDEKYGAFDDVTDLKTIALSNVSNRTLQISIEQAKKQLNQQQAVLKKVIADSAINNQQLNEFLEIIGENTERKTPANSALTAVSQIEAIVTRTDVLRRISSAIKDNHNGIDQEYNTVSFLGHRLRKSIIINIYAKSGKKGPATNEDLIYLQGYTTNQLVDVSKADPGTIIKFLDLKPDFPENDVKRLIKSYIKQNDIQSIINLHHIEDKSLRDKLQLLTRSAAKYFLLLPLTLQEELLTQLMHNKNRVWNGTFIIGYYFLSQVLAGSKTDYLMHDLEIKKGAEAGVLFKETLYEMFGNFVFLDNKGKMHPVIGLDKMTSSLASSSKEGNIKGVVGEIFAAYYYKKAMNMEVVAFGREIKDGNKIIGEIDILAVDNDGYLHDIEVKNWKIKDKTAAKEVLKKIKHQHDAIQRRAYVHALFEKLNTETLIVRGKPISLTLKGVIPRGIIVSETNQKKYIDQKIADSEIIFDVIPLVPDWLTKGMYNPYLDQTSANNKPEVKITELREDSSTADLKKKRQHAEPKHKSNQTAKPASALSNKPQI